jgi:hypothetical protein
MSIGTIFPRKRNPLYEGTPAEIESYKRTILQKQIVEAARAHRGWIELGPDELEPRRNGRFLAHAQLGKLFQPVSASPFTSLMGQDETPHIRVWNEGAICAFFVTEDGEVVCLEPAPMSLAAFDLQEKQRDWRLSEQRLRETERQMVLRTFRANQPKRVTTVADVEGRSLPTIAAAAARVIGLGGTIDVRDGRLVVERPEKFSNGTAEHEELEAEFLEAVRVLIAAGDIVINAAESTSKKELSTRLPDKHAAAGGGIA